MWYNNTGATHILPLFSACLDVFVTVYLLFIHAFDCTVIYVNKCIPYRQ